MECIREESSEESRSARRGTGRVGMTSTSGVGWLLVGLSVEGKRGRGGGEGR